MRIFTFCHFKAGAKCFRNGSFVSKVEQSVWEVSRGILRLVSCPAGHQLVNSTGEGVFSQVNQFCKACSPGQYIVTQEDVDEYGSVESDVNGRVVEAEKVCNEFNRIRLIEFNAIGFDLIEFNSISFNQIQFNLISSGCCQGTGSITRGSLREGGHVVVMQMIIALVKRDNLA